MASAQVVYLHVSYEQALQRVGGDGGRPLLARPDLAALYQRRLGVYAGVATLTVPTDGRRPEAVAGTFSPEPLLSFKFGRTASEGYSDSD